MTLDESRFGYGYIGCVCGVCVHDRLADSSDFGVARGVCRRRGRSAFVLIFFRFDVPSVGAPAPPTPRR